MGMSEPDVAGLLTRRAFRRDLYVHHPRLTAPIKGSFAHQPGPRLRAEACTRRSQLTNLGRCSGKTVGALLQALLGR
jgi:hypothetical protein